MRPVERLQAGIDRAQRNQGAHGQVREDAIRVGLGMDRLFRRHDGAFRPRGQREDALRRRHIVEPRQADEGLGAHAGRRVGQRRDERLRCRDRPAPFSGRSRPAARTRAPPHRPRASAAAGCESLPSSCFKAKMAAARPSSGAAESDASLTERLGRLGVPATPQDFTLTVQASNGVRPAHQAGSARRGRPVSDWGTAPASVRLGVTRAMNPTFGPT